MERRATCKVVASSSNQEENGGIYSKILGELQVEDTLKQEIYELEILNRHLKQENETLKAQNEIQRTQNGNILLHLGLWYKKNKKLKTKNKFHKRNIMSLQHKILTKKLRMPVTIKNARRTNLDVISQVSEEPQ